MSDIFQEVQEEYRRQQMTEMWTKYRVPIIAAATLLVASVAGYEAWSAYTTSAREAASRQFEAAAQIAETDPTKAHEAAEAFAKVAAENGGGYALVAKLQEAALRSQSGDPKSAVALYDQVAASGTGGAMFTDLARLRAAMLLADVAPFDEVKKRLDPVVANEGPWQIQAQELLAYASWRAGNKVEALRLYGLVKSNEKSPTGTKRRAEEMYSLIANGMTVADIKSAPAPRPAAPATTPAPAAPPAPAPTETQPAAPTPTP